MPIRSALFLALLVSLPVHAQTLSLRVEPPESTCPSRAAVVEALQRLVPALALDEAGEDAVIEDLGDRYRVRSSVDKVIPDPERRCDERARSAALVLAVALDQAGVEPAPPVTAPAPTAPPAPARERTPTPTAQLLFGAGIGTAQAFLVGDAQTEVAWQLRVGDDGNPVYRRAMVNGSGYVIAPLHIRTDLGVRLFDRWELLASLRAQIPVGVDAYTRTTETGAPPVGGTAASRGAFAGLVRARRRFPGGRIVPFIELAAGGGEVRPLLDLDIARTEGTPLVDAATAAAYNANPSASINRQLVCPPSGRCNDTILVGRGLVGGGAGIQVHLADGAKAGLALSLSTTFLGAFGGGATGLVVDWDLGLLVRAF